nr:hypothetical protein [Cellvibrionaceae bacterium]
MTFLAQLDPYAALEEIAKLNSNIVEATKNLGAIKDRDVQIGTTEKTAVFQQDKVVLYHYKARATQTVKT